ncbi:MAG: 30S ribosomal protein S23 [Parcubacteria group bacterium GW2011_GWC1_36_108]|nr:MAG: 30S ribosomal protein S23 [Parcubacteria group bacterium GW2011_GWC1_36_108]
MAKFETFEDIVAWQKSRILVTDIYQVFRSSKDYSFRDQIQRAAVSIMNNIAEGYERKGNKEFAKFLYIAKGSCAEVRSMLYLALDLRYINREEFNNFSEQSLVISKMLSSLIKTLC